MEQEEYNNEAINWQHIEFVDNQENRVSIFNFKGKQTNFLGDLRFVWSFF